MMIATNYKVSGLYLRGVLAGLRKITGQHYSPMLHQAGLSHFSQKYPEPTLQTAANGDQLINLLKLVRELTGPVVFNLFLANLGRGFAQAMATLPQLQAKSKELTNSQSQIPLLVEYIGELHFLAVGGRVETVKGIESDSLTIIYRDCIYCAGNELSPDPICANIPALYKQLLLELTGKRCQVSEIRCAAAQGEQDCYFELSYFINFT